MLFSGNFWVEVTKIPRQNGEVIVYFRIQFDYTRGC